VAQGKLEMTDLMLFMQYSFKIGHALGALLNLINEQQRALMSAAKVFCTLQAEPPRALSITFPLSFTRVLSLSLSLFLSYTHTHTHTHPRTHSALLNEQKHAHMSAAEVLCTLRTEPSLTFSLALSLVLSFPPTHALTLSFSVPHTHTYTHTSKFLAP